MNVKQGDLAIIIKSLAGNEGRIVSVVEFLGTDQGFCGFPAVPSPLWMVDSFLPIRNVGGWLAPSGVVPDAWLRPVSGLPEVEIADAEVTA
jgi:hypothetical protein